ncbi:MAG: DEAD/DEAH box helicase [Candidatus Sericytochromatia bacterium]
MIKETSLRNPSALIEAFAAKQKFPLDPFQREAMEALTERRSVLVSAPTGSGKTIVAEVAIFFSRATQTRCIYTTPLKALSNQKFRDLREDLGDDVGLVTGDVVINPDAQVLIMTTEILRNILQADPDRVADVSHVILDEAHYIGADGRGTVWEETIVFLGKDTSIVALSAMIPNADELATWVSSVHKPMDVIFHAERPVPLEGYVAMDKVVPLFDARGRLKLKSFEKNGWVETPLSSAVARDLHEKKMLPAIFFVFSRLGCEKEAMEVIRQGLPLTTKKEQAQIEKAVAEALEKTPGMRASNGTMMWLERLKYGVAPHHAGLLPPLKLLIEILFQRNLLKLVFATETLAAGINMPARTVVITSLSKRTDEGHRMLTVSEFAQMTGRAGRRGMDTVGYGVVLASHRYSVQDVAALFKGAPEPLRSRFTLNYNMVVNLLYNYDEAQARRIVEQCFSQFQNNATIHQLHALQKAAEAKLGKVDPWCPRYPEEEKRDELMEVYRRLKKAKEDSREKLHSLEASQAYMSKQDGARAIKAAPFYSWMIVHREEKSHPELGILLDKQALKSGDVQYTVLLEGGTMTRLALRHLVLPLNAPVKGVPKELVKRAEKLSYRQVDRVKAELPWAEWLSASAIVPEQVLPDVSEDPKVTAAKAALAAATEEMEAASCFNCRFFRKCKDEHKVEAKLIKEEAYYQEQIEAIRSKYWRQFQVLQSVLETGGFIRGRELLSRGHALSNLRTTNELLAAEVFASGLLERLEPSELCAIASGIVAEPIRGRMNWRPLMPSPAVVSAFNEMIDMARMLDKLQRRCGADEQPLYVVSDYAGLVQAWAEEAQWAHVVEIAGIDEGQLVRHLRQAIDMLQQFKDVPGVTEGFQERVRSAIALIDRDIVQEVF